MNFTPYARLQRSIRLFESLHCILEKGPISETFDEEKMYLHILECIGALSCIQRSYRVKKKDDDSIIRKTKRRIFWQSVREAAKQTMLEEDGTLRGKNEALIELLESFPDYNKLNDGRTWLPLHFAVSLPRCDPTKVQILFAAEPDSIKIQTGERKLKPCHLAAMVESPALSVVQSFKMYYPRFGSSLTAEGYTPLHVAALHSNSVEMVSELIQTYPTALKMSNEMGETPLCLVSDNMTPNAPRILQLLLEASPDEVRRTNSHHYNELPLHQFLRSAEDQPSASFTIPILIKAYEESVNIPDNQGLLPIHLAARYASVEVLKIVTEANSSNLSVIVPGFGSVAHQAVVGNKMENLKYIHSVCPEILMSTDAFNRTPLHHAVGLCDSKFIKAVFSLAPAAVLKEDMLNFNLLHLIIYRKRNGPLDAPLSDAAVWKFFAY